MQATGSEAVGRAVNTLDQGTPAYSLHPYHGAYGECSESTVKASASLEPSEMTSGFQNKTMEAINQVRVCECPFFDLFSLHRLRSNIPYLLDCNITLVHKFRQWLVQLTSGLKPQSCPFLVCFAPEKLSYYCNVTITTLWSISSDNGWYS